MGVLAWGNMRCVLGMGTLLGMSRQLFDAGGQSNLHKRECGEMPTCFRICFCFWRFRRDMHTPRQTHGGDSDFASTDSKLVVDAVYGTHDVSEVGQRLSHPHEHHVAEAAVACAQLRVELRGLVLCTVMTNGNSRVQCAFWWVNHCLESCMRTIKTLHCSTERYDKHMHCRKGLGSTCSNISSLVSWRANPI